MGDYRKRVTWGGVLALIAALLLTAVIVTAQDQRINRAAVLGGVAVYCVDSSLAPAGTYNGGGISVLWSDGVNPGRQVFFVPDDVINAVPTNPALPVFLGGGIDPHGEVLLYRLPDGDFLLTGYDNFAKLYDFRWRECNPPSG